VSEGKESYQKERGAVERWGKIRVVKTDWRTPIINDKKVHHPKKIGMRRENSLKKENS